MSEGNQDTNSDTYSSADIPSSSSQKSAKFTFSTPKKDEEFVHTTFSYGDSGGALLPVDLKVTSTKSFSNLANLDENTGILSYDANNFLEFKKSWGNIKGFGLGSPDVSMSYKNEDDLDEVKLPTELLNQPINLAPPETSREKPKAKPREGLNPGQGHDQPQQRMIDVDNPEFMELEDLPAKLVAEFHDMVHRTKWTIPLAPKEPFQILLESAISVVNKGLDRNSHNFSTFLQTCVKAFERLLGEDVRRWNFDIQEYIWQAIVLFLRLFAQKLRRTPTDLEVPREYFDIFHFVMNPHTSYHLHNSNRGIDKIEITIDRMAIEQFTTMNIENFKPDARYKLLAYAFAKFGGYEGMMEFLKHHVKEGVEMEMEKVLVWLRGLSFKTVLKPRILEKVTEHALRYSIHYIQKVPESDWKCSEVKENLHDLPFLQFIRVVQAILIIISEDKPNEWIRILDVIQLKYLLSVIQQAKLSGRLRAMEELNRLICEKGRNSESQPVELVLNITKNFAELMTWLRENQLIEILLRDNLHLPNFVDRLEKIFQAFIKEEVFEPSDLEAIWQAQVGKHDVIQRNLHGLVASLAANFDKPSQSVLLDDLCLKIKESWAIASHRERSLLVDLVGKIVERSSRSEHLDMVIIPKTTELLWNLFQDKTLSQETIDQVLKSHYDIIDTARNSDDIRHEYTNLCLEEIKKDSEFVVPILRHLQLLLKQKYSTWNNQEKLVKEEHVRIICQSIETYTAKMRKFLSFNPHLAHQMPNISFDGKYPHVLHLQQRLDFLTFVLEEGREFRVLGDREQTSWLKMEYIKILWKSLIKNPLTDEDSLVGFEFFAKQIPNLNELKTILRFFSDCVLDLDPRRLSERGLECFKTALHTVKMKSTEKIDDLEKKAVEYLWQIVLEANLEVSTLATNLLVEHLMIENTIGLPAQPQIGDINEFIQNCFTKLQQHYEWLQKEETSKQLKMKEMERMSRILKVLHFTVEQVDQKYDMERVRLPLYRATIGQCFSVKLLLTVDDIKTALENIQEVFRIENEEFDLRQLKEYNVPIEIHDNMTLEYFKRNLVKDHIYQLPIIPNTTTKYVPSFQLMWHRPDNELTRTNSNSLFISPSASDWKTLDSHALRKTFKEVGITASTPNQFSVNFDTISPWTKPKRTQKLLEKQKGRKLNIDDEAEFSSDYSLESSDSDFEVENLEEIPHSERLLPSFQIANNPDYMKFLTTLVDLGKDYEDSELAIEARRLLSLLPVHMTTEEELEAMAANNSLMNVFTNSPSCTSYYFEVIEALILPARCMRKAKQSGMAFQSIFISKNCIDQLIFALSDQNFSLGWDAYSRYTVFRVLARLVKFCSLIASNIKRRHSPKGQDNQLVHHIPTRFNSFVFRQYANTIAIHVDREILQNMVNVIKFIEDFHIPLEAIRAFMMISWSASMGKLLLINHIDKPVILHDNDTNLKYLNGDETLMCETLAIEALEAFCLSLLSCEQMQRVIAPPTAHTSGDNLYAFLVDVLFNTEAEMLRTALITATLCIVQHCGPGEAARAQYLVDLLFDNIENVEEKNQMIAPAYFMLLNKLIESCWGMFNMKINNLPKRIHLVLSWIDQAKQFSSATAESYPKDVLLSGHLNLASVLIRQFSTEEKTKLGSAVDGPQLIKSLFDEFLFPYSRAFLEMNALETAGQREDLASGSGTSPYNLQSIQRSATYAGINQTGSSTMPRSATVAHISRWVPVCGSDNSQKAAFDLIHELAYDNCANFEVVFKILVQIFYHKPFPTKIEWDYMPSFIPRGPSNYVGLKNAGATCYMNSVFQQMFMVETIRNAIINAPCGATLDIDNEGDSPYNSPTKEDYIIQVLRSVQSIFAHLLGSDLQYYEPRSFWNTFMLNGTRVNLREQQDALEFFNQLTDAVDQGMKKVGEEPIFEKTFGGTFADQKICKDCPHRYEKENLFTSISVDIRSHNTLSESLKEYVKGELLDNDNAYLCELCNKKVTAIKRLCISRLPPVLIMQLKRFDFDWERNEPIKYNDFFEFPLEIDMEPYTAQGIEAREGLESPQPQDMVVSSDDDNAPMQVDTNFSRGNKLGSSSSQALGSTRYRLRGVLVHSGQANGGHYYSFIRSNDDNRKSSWYKFDDVDVSPWELNQETMRDSWFGGEYTAEWMINRRNRSKRCWNAYLLVFEKMGPETSPMSLQSSVVPSPPVIASPNSPNYQKMDKSFGSMTLSSQRSLSKMPAQLEKLIRRKNLLSLHERSQYGHVYFGFISELCYHISLILKEYRERDRPYEHRFKTLGYVSSQLLTYFMLQTGMHAHHNLVRHYWMKWLDALEEFMHILEVRQWWFKTIVLHKEVSPLYLFDCQNPDIRALYTRLITHLLQLGEEDRLTWSANEPINPSFFDPNDTITSGTLRLLLSYPQNRYTEFLHRPSQYLQILLFYMNTSIEAKRLLINLQCLHKFLILFGDRARDDQRIRLLVQDAPIIFTLISNMLRICKVNCEIEGREIHNPHALAHLEELIPLPEDIQNWVVSGNNLNRLLRLMIEYHIDRDMVRQTIAFLCWNNLPITRKALTFLSFDKCLSTSPNHEFLNSIAVFGILMAMQDHYTTQRVILGVVGDFQYVTGYIIYMNNVRERSSRRALQLFREIVGLYLKLPHVREILENHQTFKEYMASMTVWLRENLREQHNPNPFARKYTRNLSPTRQNIEFLMQCEELWNVADTSEESGEVGEEDESQFLIPPNMSRPTQDEIRTKGLEGWMRAKDAGFVDGSNEDETKPIITRKPRGSFSERPFSERVKIFDQKKNQQGLKARLDESHRSGWSDMEDPALESSKDEFSDFDISKNVSLKKFDLDSDQDDDLQPGDAMEFQKNSSPMNVSPNCSPIRPQLQLDSNVISALEKAAEIQGEKTPERAMELPEIVHHRSRPRQKSASRSGVKRDSGHFAVVPPLPSYEASLSQPRSKLQCQETSPSPISRQLPIGVTRTVSGDLQPPSYEVSINRPQLPENFIETAEEYTGIEGEDEPPPVDP